MKATTAVIGNQITGAVIAMTIGSACAQSSITLFGTMDAGVTYVSNEKGHSGVMLTNGNNIPHFWGLGGGEDFGGGTKAAFLLRDQYNICTGAIIGNSSGLFVRAAYVGLSNDRRGSLTVKGMETGWLHARLFNCRQGSLAALGIPGNLKGAADFDLVAGPSRVLKSVEYTSAMYGGFSFGTNYVNGAFGAGVANVKQKYQTMNNGHDDLRNREAGGHYLFSSVCTNLLYTNTCNMLTAVAINAVQIGADGHLAPACLLGGDYQDMKDNARLGDDRPHQMAVASCYPLSKPKFVYIEAVYQRAHGDNADSAVNGLCGPACASDSGAQFLATLGMSMRL